MRFERIKIMLKDRNTWLAIGFAVYAIAVVYISASLFGGGHG